MRYASRFGVRVGAEHDPVLVLQEELAGGVRLPAELRDAGVDIHVHVRVLVELVGDGREVLGVVAEVRVDERRLRVLGDDAVQLVEQVLPLGELVAGEQPVRGWRSVRASAR